MLMEKTPERPLGIQVGIRRKERPGHFAQDNYGVQEIIVRPPFLRNGEVDIILKDGKMNTEGKGWQVDITLEPEGVKKLVKILSKYL